MANVKGKNNFLRMPQLKGVDIIPPAGTTGQLLAKVNGSDYVLEWVDAPTSGGGGTPSAPVSSVQFNTAGAFDGTADFIVDKSIRRVDIMGTSETTQLTIGGTTQANAGTAKGATLYIEVDSSGSDVEGLRTYFNRGTPGISGWISFDYDGATPNLCLVDEDDDSPYICFDVIGSGTVAVPEFRNTFGGAGATAAATTGFSWKINGTQTLRHDTNYLGLGTSSLTAGSNSLSFAAGNISGMTLWTGTYNVLDINSSDTNGSVFKLYEAKDNGTNYITFAAPANITSNQDIVLPQNPPATNNILGVASYSGQTVTTEWQARVQIIKTTNTDTTTNVNTTTYGIVPLCATAVFNNGTNALYASSSTTHRITVGATGWYKVTYSIPVTSLGARNALQSRTHVNGLPVGSTCYTYIRNSNDHNEDTMFGSELLPVTAGQQVDIRVRRVGTNATAATIADSGQAFISIERVQ